MEGKSSFSKFRDKFTKLFSAVRYEESLSEKLPTTSIQKYIAALLLNLDKSNTSEMILFSDDPLPLGLDGFDDSEFNGVTYEQVIRRLDEMVTTKSPNGEKQIDLLIAGKELTCTVLTSGNQCRLLLKPKNQ